MIGQKTKVNGSSPPVACRDSLVRTHPRLVRQVFVLHETNGMFVIYVDDIAFDDQTPPLVSRRVGTSFSLFDNFLQTADRCLHNRLVSPLPARDVVIAWATPISPGFDPGKNLQGSRDVLPSSHAATVFAPLNRAAFVHMRDLARAGSELAEVDEICQLVTPLAGHVFTRDPLIDVAMSVASVYFPLSAEAEITKSQFISRN